MARRQGPAERLPVRDRLVAADVVRAGDEADMLVWQFAAVVGQDGAGTTEALIAGPSGDRLGEAGVMTALLAPDGRIRAANRMSSRARSAPMYGPRVANSPDC